MEDIYAQKETLTYKAHLRKIEPYLLWDQETQA